MRQYSIAAMGMLAAIMGTAGTSVSAQQTCYTDRGKQICFPLGPASFADAVTSFHVGNPASKFANANVPGNTLGEPDYAKRKKNDPKAPTNNLTLGCGGTLTLQFRDNALVDVPGADLYVFEVGPDVEPTKLSISADGKSWINAGTIKGGVATVDISKVASSGVQYRFVRLQDAGKHCGSRWPGADIDAVGAIGSVALADGQLRVAASDAVTLAPKRIGLIFDASGSMRGKLGSGQIKINVAKRVMRSIVAELPDGPQVGLRVYGHRLPSKPKNKSCRDSELLIPFGPLDRGEIVSAVDALKPKGQTPIGRSLALMSNDLGSADGFNMIVIVSDGIETCSPKAGNANYPPEVVQEMKARGIQFRVNVVGFDIGSSKTRALLTEIAERSGGTYVGASNARELERAMRGAIELAYAVQDTAGKTVAEGTVGAGAVDLPPGRYTVVVQAEPEIRFSDVEVKSGQESVVTVK